METGSNAVHRRLGDGDCRAGGQNRLPGDGNRRAGGQNRQRHHSLFPQARRVSCPLYETSAGVSGRYYEGTGQVSQGNQAGIVRI